MKICNAEAMKRIKVLENEIDVLEYNENKNSTVSYKEGEEKQEMPYDYETTRQEINKLYAEIRAIRRGLAVANSTYIIDEFNMTIGEALVYLAQLNKQRSQIDGLGVKLKKSRRITPNGIIEYTECLFDPDKAKVDARAIYETIGKLQVAIDRANLNCFFEV